MKGRMVSEVLEKAKLDYGERGKDWEPLHDRIKYLHRQHSVRKELFGSDLSPLFKEIEHFLSIMAAQELLAGLPYRYNLKLSDEDVAYLRENPDEPIPEHIEQRSHGDSSNRCEECGKKLLTVRSKSGGKSQLIDPDTNARHVCRGSDALDHRSKIIPLFIPKEGKFKKKGRD